MAAAPDPNDEYAPVKPYTKRSSAQIMAWILIVLMVLPVIGVLLIWILG
jgi:hypothetical protein